jgi:hypothetical protein
VFVRVVRDFTAEKRVQSLIRNDRMPLLTQARCVEAGGYDTPGSIAMAGVEISAENCLFLK